ncbi:MAG TPA: peptide chain release factor 2 [Candidatus Dojkabacteria bacterium]|nr:peptide chain release factor 2 [Candidatus Dojkabacteria bacterium]HQF36239.1 peptide chain release factor 2 [Candidatus Dojkabacteria bacterium]
MSEVVSHDQIEKTKALIISIKNNINLNELNEKKTNLEILTQSPNFWNDNDEATKVQKELTNVNDDIKLYEDMGQYAKELDSLVEMLADPDLNEKDKTYIQDEIKSTIEKVDILSLDLFLSGPYDQSNATITIKAGQGGTEAQDWTGILYRMYTKYAVKRNWSVEVVDEILGESGYSTVVFQVMGKLAYGYLKKETGVHRLVRVSPFNAQGLRQTSFASVEVMPILEDIDIGDIEIRPEHLSIETMKGSGPGGQSVNTTNSAIRITHIPTGIVVKCSSQKSQIQNKETAMRIIRSKLFMLEQEKKDSEKESLRKDVKRADWGNQIRNYVLHPYKMVKDLRTKVESSDPDSVLDGHLDKFVMEEIKIK